MNNIKENLKDLKAGLPAHVKLIAVSKTKPISDVQIAYDSGQRHFGENKAQEVVLKAPALPKDIKWHFIGHLQTKKVKQIISHTHLIHSVDSEKLLTEINKRAEAVGKIQNVLLQLHIAQEEHKFGLNKEEAEGLLKLPLKHVNICGLMGMATFTDDKNQILSEFQYLNSTFTFFNDNYAPNHPDFNELSMGMSGDYKDAIACGSTMIRVGSSIFGSRSYS